MHKKLRLLTLAHQGLTKARPFGKGPEAVQSVLEHLGYVQIDTLSVVERAHHHTLWTRIPDYKVDYLWQSVEARRVFEYWFHAASFLPIKDYRFVLPQMSAIKRGEGFFCPKAEPKYMRYVFDRIRAEGPLKARDFESVKKGNKKWWNWKPTKRALERLFLQGDLMIAQRIGMEKVYDLRERVLPDNINVSEPSLLAFSEYLVDLSLRANGFTTMKQLTHLRPGTELRKAVNKVLEQKIEEGVLMELMVDGLPPLYVTPQVLETKVNRPTANVRILSPFDNAIIHRERVQQLFGFDYKLECYLPKEKRRFGYFCLPILYQDTFVGRVDCKVHRKHQDLELIDLHLESEQNDWDRFIPHFAKTIRRFAQFNDCQSIRLSNIKPKKLMNRFREELEVSG